MIYKTRGIVFHSIKYADTSLITRIYTEKFGLQSYIVRGARKPRARMKASLFQALSLLEMEVYHKEKSSLQNIKEAKVDGVFTSIPFDIRKSSIAMFLGDVLTKTIKEEEANPDLFYFLDIMIRELDNQEEDMADFHLVFMVHLSKYLGFFPQGIYHEQKHFFDLKEGSFCTGQPEHTHYIPPPLSEQLSSIIQQHPLEHLSYKHTRETRNQLLEALIKYYRLHYEGMQEIQSHLILKEIFDNP